MRDYLAQPALSRNPPTSTMTLDKQKSGPPSKPFTPTLSTTYRPSQSPLTPKLAGSKTASPTSPPRRGPRSESTSVPPSGREDFRSSTASKLSGNITPRSGPRISRIGGDSPRTPGSSHAGTPSKSRPLSAIELTKPRSHIGSGAGLGISTLGNKPSTSSVVSHVVKRRVSSSGLGTGVSTGSRRNAAAESIPPRSFAPSKIESPLQPKLEETVTSCIPPGDFARRTNSPEPLRRTPPPTLEQEEQWKFCYANGRSIDQSPKYQASIKSLNGDAAATSSAQSQNSSAQGAHKVLQQPSSPTKAASLRSAPATLRSENGNSTKPRNGNSSTKPRTSVTPSSTPRRASTSSKTSTVRQTSQRKVSIARSPPSTPPTRARLQISPRAYKPQVPQHIAIPQSPIERFSPRSTSLSSSNTAVSTQTLDSTPSNSVHPQSPIKNDGTHPTELQRTTELAANARRERKVLDLEISNSSLLAINRTLEREMHKQSLELRRFRRNSRRSGRQSTAANSVRSVSGQSALSTLPESEDGDQEYGSLSDLEEMSGSELDEDDLDSSFGDDSSLVSPTSNTNNATRYRTRDEKRLMIDLGKHQQLLIDSQKMNQSIKRCTNWTEELINEGRKALEYKVKVSDVDVGGKVLARDHDDGEDEGGGSSSRKPLLSPGLDVLTPPEVKQGRRLWRLGLEEMEMEVDRMLASSTTLKEVVPP